MKGRRHEVKIDKTGRQAPLADTSPKGATEYDMKADTRIAMDAARLVPRPKYGLVDESKPERRRLFRRAKSAHR